MKEKAISVRLDDDAIQALGELTRGGRSQSQVIRDALLLAAESDWYVHARKEWLQMQVDPAEQALLKEIRRDFFGEG